jgi:hypothetical protein
MSRKSTKNYSKLLGGLGAMYALSKLPVGEGVRPEDVNQADALADPTTIRMMQDAERKRKEDAALARMRGESSVSSNKKGGAVKGWGKARGARAAKVY